MKFLRRTAHVAFIVMPLVALLCVIVVADSQPPTPRRRERRRNPPQSQSTPTQQQASPDTRGTEQSPAVIRVLPIPKTQEDAAQEKADREQEAAQNRRILWLTGLTIFVGLGQIALGVFQYFLIERQANISDKQRELMASQNTIMESQTTSMSEQLAATKIAANAAQQSANIASESLHISQRAYLTLVDFEFGPHGPDGKPRATLTITNSGHQPGIITERAETIYIDERPPNPNDVQWEFERGSAVVPPGRNVTMSVPFVDALPTTDHWRRLVSGAMQISVCGVFRYDTGFPELQGETGFGFTYDHTDNTRKETKRFSILDSGYDYAK